MRTYLILALSGLTACGSPAEAPTDAAGVSRTQADLATNSGQKELWSKVAVDGLAAAPTGSVTVEAKVAVPDTTPPAASLDVSVKSGVRVEAASGEGPWSGKATVQQVDDTHVELALGEARSVRFEGRLAGEPLRLQAGEAVIARYEASDIPNGGVLAVRGEREGFAHALVGSPDPVTLDIPELQLRAVQVPREKGVELQVTVGRETRSMQAGDETTFKAGITVRVDANVAAPAAQAQLGDLVYRVDLTAWRTR